MRTQSEPCTPDCVGKVCGGDGCGGSCGECDEGQSCKFDGTCTGGTGCTTSCDAKNVVVTVMVPVARALRAGVVTSVACVDPGPARLPVARRSAEMTAAVASAGSALVRACSRDAPGQLVSGDCSARCVAMMGVVTAVSALRVQVVAGMALVLETTSRPDCEGKGCGSDGCKASAVLRG